ncbi:unnamed protein product [Rhodiola kirilowii]
MTMASSSPYTMAALAARHGVKRILIKPPHPSSSSISAFSTSSAPSRKLVLYSKPGCCLCDGLKEKLHSAFSLPSYAASDSLSDVVLQVRDITSNPEWENAYQYEIPVLAKVLPDGTEEVLPRLSPRLSVELVHKKIAAALK